MIILVIKRILNEELPDYNYLDNYKIYKYKKIEELSLEETLSYLTFIIRGEKFCDGHIASYLEDGTIERLGNNNGYIFYVALFICYFCNSVLDNTI